MATRTGTQRRPRNYPKALIDDDDFHQMFSQSLPNIGHADQYIEEEVDLMLFLPQSQPPDVSSCGSTVSGLAAFAESMKINIAQHSRAPNQSKMYYIVINVFSLYKCETHLFKSIDCF